jgi:hypothetical protein
MEAVNLYIQELTPSSLGIIKKVRAWGTSKVRLWIGSDDLKESFKEHMVDKGLDENFSIDKKWVEKKLKKRSIKTDTGFDVKGNLIDFEDPMKYSVRQNPDGSIDITIKNVKFYEEK